MGEGARVVRWNPGRSSGAGASGSGAGASRFGALSGRSRRELMNESYSSASAPLSAVAPCSCHFSHSSLQQTQTTSYSGKWFRSACVASVSVVASNGARMWSCVHSSSSLMTRCKQPGAPEWGLQLVFICQPGHELTQCPQRSGVLSILDVVPDVLGLLQLPRARARRRLRPALLARLGPGLRKDDRAAVPGRLACAGDLVEARSRPCGLALVAQLLQDGLWHPHLRAYSPSFTS